MTNKELKSMKASYEGFLTIVNQATDEELREMFKKKYGLPAGEDATMDEMKQTLRIWSLDSFFPTKGC